MITISLGQIKAHDPCKSGWLTLLASKGGDKADMDARFPVADIIASNGLNDALWALRCLPEHNNLWRKLAISYARDVQHLMTDPRSIEALDVAWRHSNGLATDEELAAASAAAWDAAEAAAGAAAGAAAMAAWDAAWAAWAAASAAARDAAWAAASAAARDAAWAAARAAARDAAWAARAAQQKKLTEILTAGAWVEEVGNE